MTKKSEAAVSQEVRIAVSRKGWRLFRNNKGAGKLENGSFVRWGLCNETKEQGADTRSADLIGIRPVLIRPEHVGTVIGQFCSIEVKCSDWKPRANDPHEIAQRKWQALVRSLGGYAEFISDAGVFTDTNDSIDSDVNNGDTGGTVTTDPLTHV